MIAAGIPANIFMDLFMSRFLGQGTLCRRITVATLRSFMCFFPSVPCAFPNRPGA